MKPEEMNCKVAELCGIKLVQAEDGFWDRFINGVNMKDGHVKRERLVALLPNYSGSLDAMHEAEKTLEDHELEEYACTLCQIVTGWATRPWEYSECDIAAIIRATAAQRCTAFLKVKGVS